MKFNFIEKNKYKYSNNYLDIYEILVEFSNTQKFKYFSLVKFPEADTEAVTDLIVVSNWPDYIIKHFDRSNWLSICPLMNAFKYVTKPTEFRLDSLIGTDPDAMDCNILKFINASKASGFDFNIVSNVQENNEALGLVIFSGMESPQTTIDFQRIEEFSKEIFIQANRQEQVTEIKKQALSNREHECLLWTSQGKTSYEIGMILGLSENTINNYLVSACRKLRAVNRPHMVSIAIREGVI